MKSPRNHLVDLNIECMKHAVRRYTYYISCDSINLQYWDSSLSCCLVKWCGLTHLFCYLVLVYQIMFLSSFTTFGYSISFQWMRRKKFCCMTRVKRVFTTQDLVIIPQFSTSYIIWHFFLDFGNAPNGCQLYMMATTEAEDNIIDGRNAPTRRLSIGGNFYISRSGLERDILCASTRFTGQEFVPSKG